MLEVIVGNSLENLDDVACAICGGVPEPIFYEYKTVYGQSMYKSEWALNKEIWLCPNCKGKSVGSLYTV